MANEYDALTQDANEYDDLLTADSQATRASLVQATGVNPDQYAKARDLSATTGIPADVVNRNLPAVQARAQLDEYDALLGRSPALRGQMADPDFAKLAHDDLENLGLIENLWGSLRRGGLNLRRSVAALRVADSATGLSQLNRIDAGEDVPDEDLGVVGQAYRDAPVELRPAMRERFRAGLERNLATQTLKANELGARAGRIPQPGVVDRVMQSKTFMDAAAAFGEAPIDFMASVGPESMVTSAPGLLAAIPASAIGPAGPAMVMGANSAAVEFSNTFLDQLGKAGVDIADPTAVLAATKDKDLIATALRNASRRAAVVGGFDALSGGLAGKLGFLPNLVVQPALGGAGEALGSLAAGDEIKPGDVLAEVVGEFATAPIEVATASAERIRSKVGGVVEKFADKKARAAEAVQAGADLTDITQAASESKVRARAPEAFKKFIDDADGDVTDVYVDAGVLAETLQQAGVDPVSISTEMPAALAEAMATRGDVRIPLSVYATNVAGEKYAATILPHLKTSPEAMTLAEAQEFEKTGEAQLQAEVATALESVPVEAAAEADADAVNARVMEQLSRANRFSPDVNKAYARLVTEFYRTQAAKVGGTAAELFEAMPLNVVAEDVAGGGLNQPQSLRTVKAGDLVDGRVVREDIPNQDSIAASLENHTRLPGVREVPLTMFDREYLDNFKPEKMDKRTRQLADDIKASGEVNPLIVAMDSKGAYIIEGGHRFDALIASGAKSLPAVVVIDENDPPTGVFNQSVSTRLPTAVKAKENPLESNLVVGLDSSKSDPKTFAKNIALIREYPNFRDNKSANTDDAAAEQFIKHAVDNLLWLFDQVPAETRERSKLWYEGARNIVDNWVEKYPVSDSQISGVMAVLSPQKDWFQNVSLAERVLDVMTNQQDTPWSPEMQATAESLPAILPQDIAEITGKRLGEITDDRLQAIWIRVYDQTYNERGYRLVTPEGNFGEFVSTAGGAKAKTAWGSFNEVAKAVSIFKNGDIANISSELGAQHKVRNFYNNIFDPASVNGSVTIDTHAVAAALLRPLSGSATEVMHNFGGGGSASSSVFGSNGTYGIYAEAYRRAAAERGVLAREMQSITWEAVRGLYTAGFKSQNANVARTEQVWNAYKKRRISLDEARKQILEIAGGINPPEWTGSDAAGAEAAPASSYTEELRSGERAEGAAGRGTRSNTAEGTDLNGTSQTAGARGVPDGRGVRGGAGLLAQSGRQDSGNGREPDGSLQGLPRTVGGFNAGVFAPAADVAARYMAGRGETYSPPATYVKVDRELATRIASAFEAMSHSPDDPEVAAAYQAMITETAAQYQAILDAGVTIEFVPSDGADPYAGNPRNMTEDVRNNNHMWVFSTRDGFGTDTAFDPTGNPLLAETAFTISGQPALANDLFRAVHDYFGHVKEGVGFRADGEENAWRAHSAMYSPLARRAMTTETRGQNSWLNFGPHGDANRTAKVDATVFADQKIGLLPEWATTEGAGDGVFEQGGNAARGTFNPANNTIALLKNADLSTFLHETGHAFLEMYENLAARPNAPDAIKADFQTLLDWFGVKDLATWQSMTLDQQRPHHETYARGFESYLFKGESPNTELQGIFSRFRAWLLNVYKSIKSLNVTLTPEVRGVMDRMLASEDAIRNAELQRNYAPLFETRESAGMTEAQWTAYQNTNAQATADAVDTLEKRSLRDMQWMANAKSRELVALQKDAAEKRKTVRAEVAAEVHAEPIYVALNALRTGEMRMNDEDIKVEKGFKLSTDALNAMYPPGEVGAFDWSELQKPGRNNLTAKDGLDPNMVAEIFGFSSGDELVQKLLAAPPIKEVIEQRTDERMLERYGDLTDAAAMERAAEAAIHNQARAKFVASELSALEKSTGKQKTLASAAKAFAESTIAGKKVRDLKPVQFEMAESKASRDATAALKKGDLPKAASAKRTQLINFYAGRAAAKAIAEVEKGREYLKRFDTPIATRKRIDTEYADQIEQVLERYELRRVTDKALDKRASLNAWVESQREQGFEPVIDPELLNEAQRRSYRDMSVEEFRGLIDAVKNIEHLGRLKRKLLTAKDQREFKAAVSAAADSIKANARRTLDTPLESNTPSAQFKAGKDEFFAMHRKLSSLLREMDGFKEGGELWELLVRPMNAAGDNEAVMRADATKKLTALFKPILDGEALRQKLHIPEINRSLSREGRLVVALNWGNEGNRQRLMDGDKWSEQQVQAVLGTLTKQDWDFVQSVWDYLDSYRQQIGEQQKRLTGVEPAWIEATPVQTPFGLYKGGYFPAKYDTSRSARSLSDEAAADIMDQWRGARGSAKTRDSFTKARADAVKGRPLRKDFGTVFQHITEVTHRLAWQDYLIDAQRLLRAKPIEEAIRDHYGEAVRKTLSKAVEDIAAGDVGAQNSFERAINHVRTGATIAGLGWNLTTSMLQPLGLTQSIVRIGPKWVGRGLAQWIGDAAHMTNSTTAIYAKSSFMRLRGETMQREISEIRNKVSKGSKLQPVADSFFYLIQQMQKVADIPTWLGAYEKAMEQFGDESKSVALADQAVLDSQGGGQTKDLAQVQRGGPIQKLFTNFYSFFNVTYNQMVERTNATNFKKVGDVGRLAVDYLMLVSVPAILSQLVRDALDGEDDDPDALAEKLIRAQLSALAGSMVLLREISGAVQGYSGYSGPAGSRIFSELGKLIKQVEQGDLDAALARSVNNVLGILFHYPSGQVERTVEGMEQIASGETVNPLILASGTK